MTYNINDLLKIMSRLRDPDYGCPWDIEQTSKSIINYSIEEVYELAHAIENGGPAEQQSELGDVLFQVIFLSRIAQEQNNFNFSDVVSGLCEKLLRRHPHVFLDGKLDSPPSLENTTLMSKAEVARNWEKIKQEERQNNKQGDLFDNLPINLSALKRATKIQKRAKLIGLDWPDAQAALVKIKEEIGELEHEIAVNSQPNKTAQQEELGDLLFSCVNVARKLGIDAEQALRMANDKFIRRAQRVEKALAESASQENTPAEIEVHWKAAKTFENS